MLVWRKCECMRDDFAIFICTHGRPNKQLTLQSLLNAGYTGRYYLVLDDTDETVQQYIDNFGTEHLIVFDKNHYINTSDTGSNKPVYKCILYAKDAVEDIARALNLKTFILADDDIVKLRFRTVRDSKLCTDDVNALNDVLEAYIEYMLKSDIATLGFGNSYIYIGGVGALNPRNLSNRRFTYNFILRNVSHEVCWYSEMNEDSITPILSAHKGQVWLQLPFVQFDMEACQAGAEGGMSDVYANMNKFKQYAHFLLYVPSGVRMIERFGKTTHTFDRALTFPKIISSNYRRLK